MTQEEIRAAADDEQDELAREAFTAIKELGIWNFDETNPFAPPDRFVAVQLHRDIHCLLEEETVSAGYYFVKLDSNGWTELNKPLFAATITGALLPTTGEQLDLDDLTEDDNREMTFNVHFEQLEFTLPTLLIAAAIEYAEDDDLRRRLRGAFVDPVKDVPTTPMQDAIKPTKSIEPNSKLANSITNPELYFGAGLDVSGKNERREIQTAVTISFEGDDVTLSKPMTEYDRAVHSAVATLWCRGVKTFTVRQVWYALTGKDRQPHKEQARRIEESIDKQRFTRAVVDLSAEARGRKLEVDGEPLEECIIDANMIHANKCKVRTVNGRVVTGYQLFNPPVLYQHSAAVGQLISYPIKLLDTSDVAQDTEELIVLKKYLLQRIELAKGKSKISPYIKYKTVYNYLGIKEPTRKKRKQINDAICKYLELWTGMGYIDGYAEKFEGRARVGVEMKVEKAKAGRKAVQA